MTARLTAPAQPVMHADRTETTARPAAAVRWVVRNAQPIVGWVLVGAGAVALILGYLGTSEEVLVARQLPYVVSGGLGGVSLVFLGAVLLGLRDVRELSRRLGHVERLATDLHSVLLEAAEGQAATPTVTRGGSEVVMLRSGQSYHLPDCPVTAGKETRGLTLAEAGERNLSPCKLCSPPATVAAAG